MKIAFFDTKPYDRIWFEPLFCEYGYEVKFFEHRLIQETAPLARGFDAVCAFVNDMPDKTVVDILYDGGVRALALRCAGYNNVDFEAAYKKIHIMRVPGYSPEAVAEHAAALLLSLNRKTHRAYLRTRESNFSINGLMGMTLKNKVCGVIGTGKIGRCFIDIAKGFGMDVLAYDPYPAQASDVSYVTLDEIFEKSDVISLHCPLTPENTHMINKDAISRMKDGVILINTSRGALIDTAALVGGLKSHKIGGAGLDVYEEESEYFFEDRSNEILTDDILARLQTFPNVLVTSHQAFFTKEALQSIAITTLENLHDYASGGFMQNEICYGCAKKGACDTKKKKQNCF